MRFCRFLSRLLGITTGISAVAGSLFKCSRTSGPLILGRPLGCEEYQDLRRHSRASVQHDILPPAGARWEKALVPLVQTGHQNGSQKRNAGPAPGPFGTINRGQGRSPGTKKKNTQDGVSDHMTTLANVEMPLVEPGPIQTKEVMQQGIENPAGVIRREQSARFNGNHNQPQDRGNPCLQNIVPVGVQAVRGPVLLNRIVGSLAGDHDIVHMALAQACAADADKSRLLQQLGDGRATAIAHARFQAAHHLVHDHRD